MKSRLLLERMLEDLHASIGTSPDRDISTLRHRHLHEGGEFMSVTLPLLDDVLMDTFSTGRLPEIRGWRTDRSGRPLFLNTFWKRILNEDLELSPTPCIHSIRAIRQTSRAFKKVKEVCSADRVVDSIDTFVETDRGLSSVHIPAYADAMRDVAKSAFGQTIGEVFNSDHVRAAKHGPGSVAERLSSPEKWDFRSASPRLLEHFGHDFFRATWGSLLEDPIHEQDLPARLIAVAKTATKPRLISIEPSATQFSQQAYASLLADSMRRIPICQINDEVPNQLLAKAGSIDGSLATIDLSEASDRIHYGLLKMVFGWHRGFISAIEATRTREVQLPDGRVLALNKFASMGSAMTFPVETMYFAVIVLTAVCAVEGNYSDSFVKSLLRRKDIRLYGDDIVVPVAYVPTVIEILESCGLKVNASKSFWNGNFRESCGADWFAGYPVKPVYVRKQIPQSLRCVPEIVALSSFRDQWVLQYGAGQVTAYIDEILERILPTYPFHPDPTRTPALTRRGDLSDHTTRWNPTLYSLEINAFVPKDIRKPASSTDTGRLHENLRTKSASLPAAVFPLSQYAKAIRISPEDEKKWTHDGRPTSAKLKRRWLSVVV